MASPSAREIRRFRRAVEASLGRPRPAKLDRAVFAEELGIVPDPWQLRALRSEADRLLLNCGRQTGKSTIAGILSTHKALERAGSLTLIVAPSERQAKETFSRAARLYVGLGEAVPSDSYRKLGLELRNGSRIEALPGTEKTIRGFSGVDLLIVDEAARVSDELYYAVRPMLAVSGGRLVMMSTPYGRRGVFFDEWTEGEGWDRYEVCTHECPRIAPDFLEAERRSMPEWVYRQEYCCEFAETDDQLFTFDMLERAVTEEVEPLLLGEAW